MLNVNSLMLKPIGLQNKFSTAHTSVCRGRMVNRRGVLHGMTEKGFLSVQGKLLQNAGVKLQGKL